MVALAIMAVLVALFEVLLRPGPVDSGRLWRGALVAVAAAAFVSLGNRRS